MQNMGQKHRKRSTASGGKVREPPYEITSFALVKKFKLNIGAHSTVPWGKHTPASFIHDYSAPLAANMTKEDALPVVTVRNPFDWMISMCSHSYTARWSMREMGQIICPHLAYINTDSDELQPVELSVKLANQTLSFDSLAHLWNEWYLQYERDTTIPVSVKCFNCAPDTSPNQITNDSFDLSSSW